MIYPLKVAIFILFRHASIQGFSLRTHFVFIRSLYPTNPQPKAMTNDSGRLDFLGQILVQLSKPIEANNKYFKFPSETKETIFPFTCLLRGRIIDSEATLAILRLPQNKSGEAALQRILAQYNLTAEFIDSVDSVD